MCKDHIKAFCSGLAVPATILSIIYTSAYLLGFPPFLKYPLQFIPIWIPWIFGLWNVFNVHLGTKFPVKDKKSRYWTLGMSLGFFVAIFGWRWRSAWLHQRSLCGPNRSGRPRIPSHDTSWAYASWGGQGSLRGGNFNSLGLGSPFASLQYADRWSECSKGIVVKLSQRSVAIVSQDPGNV